MIGARENGTRHRETRELLPLPPHLGLHLLYEPCTKHDDGNDAWRRYWAGRKYLPHSKWLRACECAECRAIDGTKDQRTMRYLVGRPADVSNTYHRKRDVMYVRLGVFCQEFHVCRPTYGRLETCCVYVHHLFCILSCYPSRYENHVIRYVRSGCMFDVASD